MRTLQVHINHILVHEEQVAASSSMMRGHQLKRIWCIERLTQNKISCGVLMKMDDGTSIEIPTVQIEGDAIIVPSAMNKAGFMEDLESWDGYLDSLPEKKDL